MGSPVTRRVQSTGHLSCRACEPKRESGLVASHVKASSVYHLPVMPSVVSTSWWRNACTHALKVACHADGIGGEV